MTYPPGTRVRVTFEGVVDTEGFASNVEANDDFSPSWAQASGDWLAANPDKVTVLLDEPADGGVVLDRDDVAWQRTLNGWIPAITNAAVCSWDALSGSLGPLTVIHAGGE